MVGEAQAAPLPTLSSELVDDDLESSLRLSFEPKMIVFKLLQLPKIKKLLFSEENAFGNENSVDENC